jgi:predicted dehydrogenase
MSKQSRRDFVRTTGTGALGVAAHWLIPSRALGLGGAVAPSNRITLGVIGTGTMGGIDIANFLGLDDVEIVALCDVDRGHIQATRKLIFDYYGRVGRTGHIDDYRDFRELLARPDIDAVLIATPDHWHATIAVAAAKAGKDVYGEKPLALTIAEGREMVQAMERFGRVFQVGTQARSSAVVQRAVELVRNGRIGEIERVKVTLPLYGSCEPQPVMEVPDGFDYGMWLGPAPWAPYTRMRCHLNFRMIRDYSGGSITDHGAHRFDVAQWGCNREHTGPLSVEGEGRFPTHGLFNTVTDAHFECGFADGLVYEGWTTNDQSVWGARFVGSEGWLFLPMMAPLPHMPLQASNPSILNSAIGPGEYHAPRSTNHQRDFIDCVKSRREPVAPVEVGHRSASICHLANIAMLTGRRIEWDPEGEVIQNDPQAAAMLNVSYREPWRL